jgi:hypothetical protein
VRRNSVGLSGEVVAAESEEDARRPVQLPACASCGVIAEGPRFLSVSVDAAKLVFTIDANRDAPAISFRSLMHLHIQF